MGCPTVILPGYLAGAAPYKGMEQQLTHLGYPTTTVPLTRWDWIPTIGGRSITPILEKLDETVRQLMARTGRDRINLVGHSAGGWVSRIYLGDRPYDIHANDAGKTVVWNGKRYVSTLITLGTPHISQERWTKRNLNFVNDTYPGAFHSDVQYVCIAGKAVFGDRSMNGWFTYNSYQLTCGEGACWGDEITPVAAAHLLNANNLVLDDVVHSPRPNRQWYGSPDIVKQWATWLT
jgi:triacylglycerol esterase/lipase EstA (alpha/beta hydrolase family)